MQKPNLPKRGNPVKNVKHLVEDFEKLKVEAKKDDLEELEVADKVADKVADEDADDVHKEEDEEE